MGNFGRVICFLCLSLCSVQLLADSLRATTPVLDVGATSPDSKSLSRYFAVLEDPGRKLGIADLALPEVAARFKGGQPDVRILNYGITTSAYWVRLQLRNPGDTPVSRLLEIRNGALTSVRLYQSRPDGQYLEMKSGAEVPAAQRPNPYRFYVFPLLIPPATEQTVYLRIQSRHVMFPALLWAPDAFNRFVRNEAARDAWYYGVVTAMLLFNLFIFVSLRERLYLLYVGAGAAFAMVIACQFGLAREFLWPAATPSWAGASSYFFISLSVAAYGQFFRRMLGTKEVMPRLDIALKGLVWGHLVLACALPFAGGALNLATTSLVIVSAVLFFAVCVICCLKRMRTAYFVTAAFFTVVLSAVMRVLATMNLVAPTFFALNSIEFGSAIAMLILAFALADRFAMIRRKAMIDVEAVNASLAGRLQVREAELTTVHERLREAEMRQTLSNERQRLMQDMHDGLGSSLVTALRGIERGGLRETELASVLQGCIDDLKLAIDSMEPVEADLLLLLATLRFRLGQRIERAGITLRWNIDDVPRLDWLDPRNALHILRILQEAIANVIKHTQANEICVATAADGERVHVSITDNGQGFQLEEALTRGGKGLSNQMRRAEAIGGTVHWTSNATGTCFTLTLPVERAHQPVVTES